MSDYLATKSSARIKAIKCRYGEQAGPDGLSKRIELPIHFLSTIIYSGQDDE